MIQEILDKSHYIVAINPRFPIPILYDRINTVALERYNHLDLSRLYGLDSPLNMTGVKETNSLYFYKPLLTLLVYEEMDDSHLEQIGRALTEMTP